MIDLIRTPSKRYQERQRHLDAGGVDPRGYAPPGKYDYATPDATVVRPAIPRLRRWLERYRHHRRVRLHVMRVQRRRPRDRCTDTQRREGVHLGVVSMSGGMLGRIIRPRRELSISMTSQSPQYDSSTERFEMDYRNVPLVTLAGEVGLTTDDLAQRFGDAVVIDDVTGLRAVATERCREFLANHRAAEQEARDREEARRAELAAQPNLISDRVKAIAAAQRQYQGNPDVPVLTRLLEADPTSGFARASANLDEQRSGVTVMHRIKRGDR